MLRIQFAIQLAELLGMDASSADAAVTSLSNAGITTARSSADFNGESSITREQAATMFARAFDITGSGQRFSDVGENTYYSAAVAGLYEAGIFSGYSDGTFGVGETFNHFDAVAAKLTEAGYLGGQVPSQPTTTPSTPDPVQDVQPSVPVAEPTVPDEPPLDEDALAWAAAYIEQEFDLPNLGEFVTQMVEEYGASVTPEDIDLRLRTWTDSAGNNPWHDRFGAVMDGRAAAGLNAISAAEILEFEDGARALMRASGLPAGFYDEQSDFHEALINDVSLAEMQDRIIEGFVAVQQAPIEVRQAFTDLVGVSGEEALASYFMDPDRALPAIERQVTTSQIMGMGTQHRFNINADVAGRLAAQGVDQNLAFTGFARLAALNPVFQETVGEGEDLDALEEGIEAQFFQDAEATREIEQRVAGRTAAFRGGGGAAATSEGVIGLGTSR